jgi:transposase-like protein
MRKLLKKQGFAPDVLGTDKLRSYGAAKAEIGLSARHERGSRKNNRAEEFASTDTTVRAEDAAVQIAWINPNDTCPFTPPFTTRSTSSVISLRAARFAS